MSVAGSGSRSAVPAGCWGNTARPNAAIPRGRDDEDRLVAALVLVVDPESRTRIDPALVAASLGLTTAESQVAAMLGEGRSVREIATATGRKERTIRWHVEQIFGKHGLSRQAELVRLVLSLAGAPGSRH